MARKPKSYSQKTVISQKMPPVLISVTVALLLLGFLVGISSLVIGRTSDSFVGVELVPPRDAMAFHLTDQFGDVVHLTNLTPKLVVLTFLYTHCPDICPLTTGKLHQAYKLLGHKASLVQFLVVTVDPERDSQLQVKEYSERYGMLNKWHFLIGNEKELDPIWKYYWVGNNQPSTLQNLREPSNEFVADNNTLTNEASKPVLSHSAPIHIIKEGLIRLVYGESFQPTELAHDLEILLRQ
jgi:protein SCO1/2